MDLTLLTTCILRDAVPDVLLRMLRSVEANAEGHDIRLFLLLQNCDAERAAGLPPLPGFVTLLTVPSMLSLSAARNILLKAASNAGTLHGVSLVAFPDDDCWYPEGLVSELKALFADPTLDFAFCKYATATVAAPRLADIARPADASTVARNASSNTIFIRGDVVARIGRFDPALGVGTPNNGGEDIEYALRAFIAARKTVFLPAELVGHRDKMPELRAKYYRGCLMALRRHAGTDSGVAREYARKLAVGLALVLRREMSLKDFTTAIAKVPAPTATLTGTLETI